MADFHFLSPQWLWMFIPSFTVLIYLLARTRRQYNEAGQGVIAEHLARHFRAQSDSRLNVMPIYSAALIATLMILVLAQPVWRQASEAGQGAPLLIVMDASQSMLRNDVSPTRDARAHLLVSGLLDKGLNRPVGLIAVAGSSHVLLPPAVDAGIVKLYLSYLDPGVMPVDGGDLSSLVRLLESTPGLMAPGTDILLVTDGMSSGFEDFKAFLGVQKASLVTLTFTAQGAQTGNTLGVPGLSGDTLTPQDTRLYALLSRMQRAGSGSSDNWIDEYRWMVIPAALLLLFWFRRGVTLYWAPAVIALVLVTAPNGARADVIDWFFTPDQQGMLLLQMGNYNDAALRFNDPGWKAVACYYAEDWACAQKYFAQMPTESGVFNMALAAAQGGEYKLARDIFAQLLKINPDYPRARSNYEQLAAIVDEINAMSDSQKSERPPPPNEDGKLEGGDPDNIADGAEEKTMGPRNVKQLTAAEVLASDDMTDLWLRDISRDPRGFVRARFQYEYTKQQETLDAP